ncbi:MAG: hypothetical protein K2N78_13260 [Oscillospiraceae bacterium]|nr:hypothetical protein [Oscillospiraceae bacterium]
MKKKKVCLVLAALLALAVCTSAALAFCQPETASAIAVEPLYCHGSGHHGGNGHHGGQGHHGSMETCDWLFHAYGDCMNVYCTDETHVHRCEADCDDVYHQHYSVCQYSDGTLALGQRKACSWLFHACGDCTNVYCTDETHAHRCKADCDNVYHQHYGVCQYADGTLALGQRKA